MSANKISINKVWYGHQVIFDGVAVGEVEALRTGKYEFRRFNDFFALFEEERWAVIRAIGSRFTIENISGTLEYKYHSTPWETTS